ncbi:MAG: proline--tRNA ligase [Candidatus Aminicenantes bacterium RBG_13_63_10]|nr:MAG: proline--tRNA ligase [Candidatus Aminicenantes bacterium RBG_13_63_10]
MAEEERLVKQVSPKSEDFSKWYLEIIRKTEMADYAPMKGMMVIRPYGYAVWENIQRLLDRRLKAAGHVNAYFPLFIPESFLQKEMAHVEGFAPEVAWVTQGGRDELEERLAVRPTSEAIIGSMYAKWIKSYRDLPVLINQWANIVRWEKVTRPFLRTTEFLWQEGHTAHATEEEARKETLDILDIYREFVETELAVPTIRGRKTEWDKFAGAVETYSLEALMADGKALQMGTSHHLGQNFSKVFNIRFEDRNQALQFVWQTSWGVSTRLIGSVVMVHGDDSGLRIPPAVAPVQVVIVPISMGNWKETVLPVAKKIEDDLRRAGVRVTLDDREEFTPGWKFSDWEMRGVPLRLEVGPRDIKEHKAVAVRRDVRGKASLPLAGLSESVNRLLAEIQSGLLEQARDFLRDNTRVTDDYGEFKRLIDERRGFILSPWCGARECEEKVKQETAASIRVLPLDTDRGPGGVCLACGRKSESRAFFARAY